MPSCSISLCDAELSCQERLSDLEYLSLVLIVYGVPGLLAVAWLVYGYLMQWRWTARTSQKY